MATGFEVPGSRSGSSSGLVRRYRVEDATDEEEMLDWIAANTPASLFGVPRAEPSYQETDELDGSYDVDVNYGFQTGTPLNQQKPEPEVDSVEYRFSFQAQGGHFMQSLATVGRWGLTGENSTPDFGGLIGVHEDANSHRVEGMYVSPPAETFTLVYYPSYISTAYQLLLESICGTVNSTPFKTRPAGSLMLVRATGGTRDASKWQLELGFGYVPNRGAFSVGDVSVPAKDGLDLLWPYYQAAEDDALPELIVKPFGVYIERVWFRSNFNALGI